MEHTHISDSSRAANPSSDRHLDIDSRNRKGPGDHRAWLYQQELDRAKTELDEERHRPLGFLDDIKNLFGWIETPEERVSRNRPDVVD